jgi:PIN like domain
VSSRKPSSTQKLREAFNTLYFDEDVGGPKLKAYLDVAGLRKVELWIDHIARSTPDPEWLKVIGGRGWAVFTADKAIETDPVNLAAAVDAKAKIFILDGNSSALHWCASILVARERIYQLITDEPGPFFVNLNKYSHRIVSDVRRPAPPPCTDGPPENGGGSIGCAPQGASA